MDVLSHVVTAVLEVELPSALLVDLVTWSVLLPATIAGGNGSVLLNATSYVQHGANAVVLLIDFGWARPAIHCCANHYFSDFFICIQSWRVTFV